MDTVLETPEAYLNWAITSAKSLRQQITETIMDGKVTHGSGLLLPEPTAILPPIIPLVRNMPPIVDLKALYKQQGLNLIFHFQGAIPLDDVPDEKFIVVPLERIERAIVNVMLMVH